ncbi:MAG: hypothetical protein QOF06_293 [Solirubrobacterales bacterium]|jgi:hypothetical protein|nr:hypothetical protein [Solirubrobacterales bacterium]
MDKKRLILALAVSSAMFALPAGASAGTWHINPSTSSTSFSVTRHENVKAFVQTPNRNTTCETIAGGDPVSGSGVYNIGGETGNISLTFSDCESLGTDCTTPGQGAGIIKTSLFLVIHNILLEAGPPKVAGIKITGVGETTQIMHYTCGFGLVTINVTGTVIGQVEQACGFKGKFISANFAASKGSQEWKRETTTGTSTDLTATVNGTAETAGLIGTFTLSFGASERTTACT